MNRKFKLPSGWYRDAINDAIINLEEKLQQPLTRENAWLFLYACVAWFEETPKHSGQYFLHVDDRLKDPSGKMLSKRAEAFLQQHLPNHVEPRQIVDQIGRFYAEERHAQGHSRDGWQRNNITGNAFEATLQVLIHRLTGRLPQRTPLLNTLQGFELAPEGYHARPDLVLFSARDFRLLISTKWTLRKERVGTYLHEAYFYKRRRPDLQIAFVVTEFRQNILRWLANDPLVDRVYHVCLPLLLASHKPFESDEDKIPVSFLMQPRSSKRYMDWLQIASKVRDIKDLFADIDTLSRTDFNVDPEEEEQADAGLEDL